MSFFLVGWGAGAPQSTYAYGTQMASSRPAGERWGTRWGKLWRYRLCQNSCASFFSHSKRRRLWSWKFTSSLMTEIAWLYIFATHGKQCHTRKWHSEINLPIVMKYLVPEAWSMGSTRRASCWTTVAGKAAANTLVYFLCSQILTPPTQCKTNAWI